MVEGGVLWFLPPAWEKGVSLCISFHISFTSLNFSAYSAYSIGLHLNSNSSTVVLE